MKRPIAICGIMLLLAGFLSCATSGGASSSAKQPGSSVWKISRDGNTLFLGGSIHILRDADFPLPGEFDRAFEQSAVLVLEADVDQMANEDITEYIMSRMMLPDGQTLRSVLDSDTYQMLDAECRTYGFPADAVATFKPSMVMTMLSMFQMQKLGFLEDGADTLYYNRAKKENKPVDFLETVITQIDALVSMGDGYENDYVRYSLQDISDTETMLGELVAHWKRGDASSTEAMLTDMREAWPLIYNVMVIDRNAAWMPKLEGYLASGQVYFVIVGLAHLHGPNGLLLQLENSGCTIEQFIYR